MGLRGWMKIKINVGVEFLAVQVLVRSSTNVLGIVEQFGNARDAADERQELGVLHRLVERLAEDFQAVGRVIGRYTVESFVDFVAADVEITAGILAAECEALRNRYFRK